MIAYSSHLGDAEGEGGAEEIDATTTQAEVCCLPSDSVPSVYRPFQCSIIQSNFIDEGQLIGATSNFGTSCKQPNENLSQMLIAIMCRSRAGLSRRASSSGSHDGSRRDSIPATKWRPTTVILSQPHRRRCCSDYRVTYRALQWGLTTGHIQGLTLGPYSRALLLTFVVEYP
jgi:hypothetical protein